MVYPYEGKPKPFMVKVWIYQCPVWGCHVESEKPGRCEEHDKKLVWTRYHRKPKYWVIGGESINRKGKSLNQLIKMNHGDY